MIIGRAPIADRMHLAHRCDALVECASVGALDPETVIIIRGDDENWYIQDAEHRPLCRAVTCFGCGGHLENELRHLTILVRGAKDGTRLPTYPGLP